MKNKIKILIVLLSTISLAACSDFLTDVPESALTQDNFYTTQIRINSGILGCYSGLAKTYEDEWRYTELRSDNTDMSQTGSSSTANVELADLAFFRPATTYPDLQDYWYLVFQNISNINAVLPSVADNTYITNEPLRAQYEGELLFMRALHYYKLVNLFGDMFKITTVIGPNEAKKLTRRPVTEIYNDIIIPDLIKASSEAPSVYTSTEKGRVTKWAAKVLLAKSYMMLGGDANLALAKTLLQDVITNSGHAMLTGTDAYANIFSTSNEMNNEIIFAVRYKGGTDGIGSPFFGTFAPYGTGITITKVGTPLGYNSPTTEIATLFRADPSDTRTNTCFKTNVLGTKTYFYVCKYTDPNQSAALQAENDWIEIRMADVKLLLAEILAQGTTPNDALVLVNEVRTRAGVNPYINFADKTEALDSVYQERRLELAFENHRWFDLLRMNKSYNDSDKAMKIMKKHVFETDWVSFYSLFNPILPPQEGNFINGRLLLPIPESEIITNNEMEIPQNDSY